MRKGKNYSHFSFRMHDASWAAVEFLKTEVMNMSFLVRKALIREIKRITILKTIFPKITKTRQKYPGF